MSYTVSKDFAFSASHQLDQLPEDHQCARLHGHNYVVRVTLTSMTLDHRGFVMDYGDLKPFGKWIDDNLDHRHLNDVLGGPVTAEQLAERLLTELRRVIALDHRIVPAVGVSETPKTWAWFQ